MDIHLIKNKLLYICMTYDEFETSTIKDSELYEKTYRLCVDIMG